VCPSNFWQCVIAGVSFVLLMGEAMLQNSYQVQRHLSFHSSNFKIITYEDSGDGRAAENSNC
jgi:hypothetical protein